MSVLSHYGLAVDLGTTTIEVLFDNLDTGEVVRYTILNPQYKYGKDIVSRIRSAENGRLPEMQKAVVDALNELTAYLVADKRIVKIPRMTVCGNSVMTHILAGVDPSGMARAPYMPKFTDLRFLRGKEIGLKDVEEVVLLPAVSAFVGSDAVAGYAAATNEKSEGATLLVDLGTNGEMIVDNGAGEIFCTSVAAGPTFEGGGIECGRGASDGAIKNIVYYKGELRFETIGSQIKGLSGSALVDAVAILLRLRILDRDGRLSGYAKAPFQDQLRGDRFYLTENVYLSQKDIRSFQTSKSAVYSGIVALIEKAGLDMIDIRRVDIAGALGHNLDLANAIATGLFPRQFGRCISLQGNASARGALACLRSEKFIETCLLISKKAKTVELATDPFFQKEFIANMDFFAAK